MVEISSSGSGEGPGWVTAPGYSTAAFPRGPIRNRSVNQEPRGNGLHIGAVLAGRRIQQRQ